LLRQLFAPDEHFGFYIHFLRSLRLLLFGSGVLAIGPFMGSNRRFISLVSLAMGRLWQLFLLLTSQLLRILRQMLRLLPLLDEFQLFL
jgi:hypothetical protein